MQGEGSFEESPSPTPSTPTVPYHLYLRLDALPGSLWEPMVGSGEGGQEGLPGMLVECGEGVKGSRSELVWGSLPFRPKEEGALSPPPPLQGCGAGTRSSSPAYRGSNRILPCRPLGVQLLLTPIHF